MKRGRLSPKVNLTVEERKQLESMVSSLTLAQGLAKRAKLVLLSADGMNDVEISKKIDWTRETVGKWRRRYLKQGLQGLYDELRPGRPRTILEDDVADLIHKTLHTRPENGTHWSCRTMAEAYFFFQIYREPCLEHFFGKAAFAKEFQAVK